MRLRSTRGTPLPVKHRAAEFALLCLTQVASATDRTPPVRLFFWPRGNIGPHSKSGHKAGLQHGLLDCYKLPTEYADTVEMPSW